MKSPQMRLQSHWEKKILDPGALSNLLQKLESSNMTIQRAFEKQVKATAVSPLFFGFTTKLMF
jgi:hypothetical protein